MEEFEQIKCIENADECVKILRREVLGIIEAIKETTLFNYETLLQEAEAKVREHIRVTTKNLLIFSSMIKQKEWATA